MQTQTTKPEPRAAIQDGRAPQPPSWPLVGHIPLLMKKGMMQVIREGWEQFGDVFELRAGRRRMVVLAHPDLGEHAYVKEKQRFYKGPSYDNVRMLVGNHGLLTTEGDEWKRQRRLAQPSFHKKSIMGMVPLMMGVIKDVVASWRKEHQDGAIIDIYPEMMHLALRVIGETLFSIDLSREMGRSVDAFTVALEKVSERGNSFVSAPKWLPTPANLSFRRSLKTLDDIVYGVVDERLEKGIKKQDLLGMWLEAAEADESPMPRETLRDELITMFLAGHETTAIAVTWAFHLLSQHPEEQDKLFEEGIQALQHEEIDDSVMEGLAYTGQIFHESMRLYPPVWTLARDVAEDHEIGGVQLYRDNSVIVPTFLLHRHPGFWEEPDAFRPERFAPEAEKKQHRGSYIPFARGPRMCIGNHFSTIESQLILAAFCANFRFSPVPGANIGMTPQITLRPSHGMPLQIHHRH
ncbi:MAG: cytochrome P450 [Myxococcales bacterium]|nr:cytochrome P450 [Myxococcales bacterium]MCB9642646.1 cytochrome P450 [Myxococcales bacterium]